MVVDGVDGVGDADGDGVPAEVVWVVGVQIVLGVGAVTLAVLDDVLVFVADDDDEIPVAFDPPLADGFDGPPPTGAVVVDDGRHYLWGQFPRLAQSPGPLVDGGHTPPTERPD